MLLHGIHESLQPIKLELAFLGLAKSPNVLADTDDVDPPRPSARRLSPNALRDSRGFQHKGKPNAPDDSPRRNTYRKKRVKAFGSSPSTYEQKPLAAMSIWWAVLVVYGPGIVFEAPVKGSF